MVYNEIIYWEFKSSALRKRRFFLGMHKVTFFPLGNADCCRIDTEAGKKILFDYAATRCADDEYDVRIDLPAELRADLKQAKRNDYDAVAFTHLSSSPILCMHSSKNINGTYIASYPFGTATLLLDRDGLCGFRWRFGQVSHASSQRF